MPELFFDIETYSSVDLKKSVVDRYVEADDFQILMAAWSIDGGEIRVSLGHRQILADLGEMLRDPAVTKVAHHARFERVCMSRLLMPALTYLDPEPWEDTAVLAAEAGLPRSLDKAARALGLSAKDSAGTRLINLFSKPNGRTGKQVLPDEKPEQWVEFIDYCRQDVQVLIELYRALQKLRPAMTRTEREIWLVDQRINDRGVRVDLDLAALGEAAAEENKARHKAEVTDLTGVVNPGSVPQMMAWAKADGLDLPNLQADTVAEALAGDLSPTQRRVLELRQKMALTTSKKYGAALRWVNSDGRLRGTFRFFGAITGRWSSIGIQLHNLSRSGLEDPESVILDLKLGLGADDEQLKALVRPLLLGPLVAPDFAQIEARVLAWEAGETWVLEAFREGRDIYSETAAKAGPQYDRQDGKTMVLALGFNGGVSSLRVMGASGDDDTLQQQVFDWRDANPRIVRLWRVMDRRFGTGGPVGEHLEVKRRGKDRLIKLPSGRYQVYRNVRRERWFDPKLGEKGDWREGWRYDDPKGFRNHTYGGSLIEGTTQGIARDLLAEAMVQLDRAGYRIVAHVHDEALVEGTDAEGVSALMRKSPSWARGIPIDASAEVLSRYKKG